MNNTSMAALAAVSLSALLASTPAHSQTKEPRVVSRDELRVCMNSEDDLAKRRAAIQERDKQLGAEKAALATEQQQLTEDRKLIRDDEYAKQDRFNRRMRVFNEKVKTVQGSQDAFNKDLDGFNQQLTAHNGKCGGISFNPDDKAAILKEREAKN